MSKRKLALSDQAPHLPLIFKLKALNGSDIIIQCNHMCTIWSSAKSMNSLGLVNHAGTCRCICPFSQVIIFLFVDVCRSRRRSVFFFLRANHLSHHFSDKLVCLLVLCLDYLEFPLGSEKAFTKSNLTIRKNGIGS